MPHAIETSIGSTTSPLAISIWLITKMLVRLWLLATRVRLITLIGPKAKVLLHADLYRVECGEWMLQLTMSASDPLPSGSKRRTRKQRSKEAGSLSTGTTNGLMAPPVQDASSSTGLPVT